MKIWRAKKRITYIQVIYIYVYIENRHNTVELVCRNDNGVKPDETIF